MKIYRILFLFALFSVTEIFSQDAAHPLEIPDSCVFIKDTLYAGCGDSFNGGVFYPIFDCPIDNYKLKIYNSWGEFVFETDRKDGFWDYTFDRLDGTFYYFITGIMSDSGTPFAVEKKGTIIVYR